MTSKKEVAHTMGILLGLNKWEGLLKLSEDLLFEMYRNYIKNAMEYNHLEDKVKDLGLELAFDGANKPRAPKHKFATRRH